MIYVCTDHMIHKARSVYGDRDRRLVSYSTDPFCSDYWKGSLGWEPIVCGKTYRLREMYCHCAWTWWQKGRL